MAHFQDWMPLLAGGEWTDGPMAGVAYAGLRFWDMEGWPDDVRSSLLDIYCRGCSHWYIQRSL